MPKGRAEQLAYSETMGKMLDEGARRRKAAKLTAVLRHALGVKDLTGLTAVDIGCSAGFIADELAQAGALTHGIDIDEPGLAKAAARFGQRVKFHLSNADNLPFEDGSVDVIVFNHIYEHMVSPEAAVREMRRILAPKGAIYLGLANRFGVIEPHYRLPFLSWLPPSVGDRYVRAAGRGDEYYERLKSRRALRQLFSGFDVWDYTLPVLAQPQDFSGEDVVPKAISALPHRLLLATLPLVPTYIWVGFAPPRHPAGPRLVVPPRRLPLL